MKFLLNAILFLGLLSGGVSIANTFAPSNTYPGDTRTAVSAPGTPWRSIGKLSLPDHRFMTASLVGPDVILTAAHGLVKNGKLIAGTFIFRPDFGSQHNRTNDFATVTRAWVGTYTPQQKDCVHSDWALLQLDRNLGDAYGTLRVDDANQTTLSGSGHQFYISSYNKDFKYGTVASWQTGCGFVALDPLGYLLHDFSTDRGASGSPIFYLSGLDGGARIVALNVAEKTAHDETLYGVPFSPHVANVAISSHEFFQTLSQILTGTALSSGQAVVGKTVSSDAANSQPSSSRSNQG